MQINLRKLRHDGLKTWIRWHTALLLDMFNYCWADLVHWDWGNKAFEDVSKQSGCGYCKKCLRT